MDKPSKSGNNMTCSLMNRFRQAPMDCCVSRFASGFHKVFGWQFTGFSPAIDHPMALSIWNWFDHRPTRPAVYTCVIPGQGKHGFRQGLCPVAKALIAPCGWHPFCQTDSERTVRIHPSSEKNKAPKSEQFAGLFSINPYQYYENKRLSGKAIQVISCNGLCTPREW